MKKIIFIVLGVFILSGCGSKTAEPEKEELTQTEQERSSSKEKADIAEDPSSTDKSDDEKPVSEDDPGSPDEVVEPAYVVNPSNWTIEPIENSNDKVVLLTIDDAPEKYAVEMANELKELGVPAIFFINGHFIDTDEEKEKLKAIHELGFKIGNHTLNHAMLDELTEEEQRNEIILLNDQIEDIIGERPIFFRAPYGVNTDFSNNFIREENMVAMNWTYGYDWVDEYLEEEALTEIMVDSPYLTEGANLLMHDREWTKDALKGIVEGLQNKGYEFVDPALITSTEPVQK